MIKQWVELQQSEETSGDACENKRGYGVRKIYKSRKGLWLKGKKGRPNKVVYSKKYISSVHGKVGQREKGSGNRT